MCQVQILSFFAGSEALAILMGINFDLWNHRFSESHAERIPDIGDRVSLRFRLVKIWGLRILDGNSPLIKDLQLL